MCQWGLGLVLIVMDSKEVMVGMSPISDDELNSKSAVSALLGRHHNIHPKHPNHSLIVLDMGKKKKTGKMIGFEH